MGHWMFECKQISELVSQGMDCKLPLRRRIGIRFHLMMCKFCTRYQKQLHLLRDAARQLAKAGDTRRLPHGLSKDAKERMKNALRQAEPPE